jgi:hypothetical protein
VPPSPRPTPSPWPEPTPKYTPEPVPTPDPAPTYTPDPVPVPVQPAPPPPYPQPDPTPPADVQPGSEAGAPCQDGDQNGNGILQTLNGALKCVLTGPTLDNNLNNLEINLAKRETSSTELNA